MEVNNDQNKIGQQNIDSNVYNYYGEKKIKKYLTTPFFPDVFLGREEELLMIRNKLFTDSNLLLLVNGMGGIGKTSLAAQYYLQYQDAYQHLAWVFAQTNIADALLTLAGPLQLTFAENTDTAERLQQLLDELRNLNKPCLLIIDNANELEDLQANYVALRSCPNFHLLLTTRLTTFAKAVICPVGALPYEKALQLFTEYYSEHDTADDALFEQVYNAVAGNTLIIELLAKNLALLNEVHTQYSLAQLVADLQQGLLKITQTKPVDIHYHTNALFKGAPLDIITAMYDVSELTAAENRLLGVMAVLPAENIPFATLQALLPNTTDAADTLASLSCKGWLEHNKKAAAFKISPVIQEITRAKNTDLLGDCGELIRALVYKLDYDESTGHFANISYQDAPILARYGEIVLGHFTPKNEIFIALLERLGRCHQTLGNLPQALHFYTLDAQLCETLGKANPDDADLKNGLAISYEKLGETYAAMGNLQEALQFYELRSQLGKELFDDYPDNVGFKNGLAISYEKLGQIYASMGNLQEALQFYELDADLSKQLFDDYPHNVAFKNGLAIAYSKLGETYASMGNLQEALQFYEQQTVLFKQLFDEYPDNVTFKNGLAISYTRLGLIYEAQQEPAKARELNEKAKAIWQQLVSDSPEYAEFKKNLEWVNSKLA